MDKKCFCDKCDKYVEYYTTTETLKEFKGYIINEEIKIAKCKECGQNIWSEYDAKNLKNVYKKYREVANTITPKELDDFLKEVNISTEELAKLSGISKFRLDSLKRDGCLFKEQSDKLRCVMSKIRENKDLIASKFEFIKEKECELETAKLRLMDTLKKNNFKDK
jgi:hypothetical protein